METIKNNRPGYDYEKSLKKRNIHIVDKFIKIERYINRPLASLIVKAVFNTRITPNGLTFCNFLLGLLAAFFFSRGEYLYSVLGGISIQLSSIVDSADGMLARAKNMCSDYGAYLDIFLDRITDFCLIVGITLGLYSASNDINLLIIGLVSAGLYSLQINLWYLIKNYLKKKETGETGEVRALGIMMILIFSIANRLDIIIWILLVETVINNSIRVMHFIRLGRKKCNRSRLEIRK